MHFFFLAFGSKLVLFTRGAESHWYVNGISWPNLVYPSWQSCRYVNTRCVRSENKIGKPSVDEDYASVPRNVPGTRMLSVTVIMMELAEGPGCATQGHLFIVYVPEYDYTWYNQHWQTHLTLSVTYLYFIITFIHSFICMYAIGSQSEDASLSSQELSPWGWCL